MRLLVWCLCGGIALLVALKLTGYTPAPEAKPTTWLFLASLGGSTVFLFLLPGEPATQPWPLLGGHLLTALIGILCYLAFGDHLWVCVLAVMLAMVVLAVLGAIHPPAGANPLIMVHGHANLLHAVTPVLLGVGVLFIVRWLLGYIGQRHGFSPYPVAGGWRMRKYPTWWKHKFN